MQKQYRLLSCPFGPSTTTPKPRFDPTNSSPLLASGVGGAELRRKWAGPGGKKTNGQLEPGLGLPSTTQRQGLLSFTSRAGDLGPWSLTHSGQPTLRPGSQGPLYIPVQPRGPRSPAPASNPAGPSSSRPRQTCTLGRSYLRCSLTVPGCSCPRLSSPPGNVRISPPLPTVPTLSFSSPPGRAFSQKSRDPSCRATPHHQGAAASDRKSVV